MATPYPRPSRRAAQAPAERREEARASAQQLSGTAVNDPDAPDLDIGFESPGTGFERLAPPGAVRRRPAIGRPPRALLLGLAVIAILAAQVGTVMSAVNMWRTDPGTATTAGAAQPAPAIVSARDAWHSSVRAVAGGGDDSGRGSRAATLASTASDDPAARNAAIAAGVARLAEAARRDARQAAARPVAPAGPVPAADGHLDPAAATEPVWVATGEPLAGHDPAGEHPGVPQPVATSLAVAPPQVVQATPSPRPRARPWTPSTAPGSVAQRVAVASVSATANLAPASRSERKRQAPRTAVSVADPPVVARRVSGRHPAGLRDAAWLLGQPPGHFTLQLVSITDAAQVAPFVKRLSLPGDLAAFRRVKRGSASHVLVHGIYPDRAAAERASNAVLRTHKIKPWVRKLGDLQGEIRKPT